MGSTPIVHWRSTWHPLPWALITGVVAAFDLWVPADRVHAAVFPMLVPLLMSFLSSLVGDRLCVISEGVLYLNYALFPLANADLEQQGNRLLLRWVDRYPRSNRIRVDDQTRTLIQSAHAGLAATPDRDAYPKTQPAAEGRIWIGQRIPGLGLMLLWFILALSVYLVSIVLPVVSFFHVLTPFVLRRKPAAYVANSDGLWLCQKGEQPQLIPYQEMVRVRVIYHKGGASLWVWRRNLRIPLRFSVVGAGRLEEQPQWRRLMQVPFGTGKIFRLLSRTFITPPRSRVPEEHPGSEVERQRVRARMQAYEDEWKRRNP